MIKTLLEDLIKKLNAEKTIAINTEMAKTRAEVITPKNAELEKAKSEKIAQINAETNTKINGVNEECVTAKKTFEDEQIALVTARVGAPYDTEIANAQKRLDDIGETN